MSIIGQIGPAKCQCSKGWDAMWFIKGNVLVCSNCGRKNVGCQFLRKGSSRLPVNVVLERGLHGSSQQKATMSAPIVVGAVNSIAVPIWPNKQLAGYMLFVHSVLVLLC